MVGPYPSKVAQEVCEVYVGVVEAESLLCRQVASPHATDRISLVSNMFHSCGKLGLIRVSLTAAHPRDDFKKVF